MNTHLLIVDPQVDFCQPGGALAVPGADADMVRLAAFLRRASGTIDQVHVTLDTHHFLDISHPQWWRDAQGHTPAPFTILSGAALDAGTWRAADPARRERSRAYVAALEASGRYPLCLWPPHCLIGSPGHAIDPALRPALWEWEATHGPIDFIIKGHNVWTEHYSALRADVPDPDDAATRLNLALLAQLRAADRIVVAGEAGSHCVAHTVRDLVDAAPETAPRLTLLADAVSPVPGFEAQQEAFLADLCARGMTLATTREALR